MEGQFVDNSAPVQSPAPAAPEPAAAPTPVQAPAPQPAAQPGARSMDTLHALLDGADPATLFGAQPPAAAPEPQPAEPTPATPPAPTEPRIIDKIPDKFKNPDGTLNAETLLKSYVGMEKILGEQGNKLGTYERQLQEAAQLFQYYQQQANQPQPPQPDEQNSIPEPEWTPPTMDEYYEDPLGTVNKLLEKQANDMMKQFQAAIQPLTPVVEKHQYDSEVNRYSQQLVDFAQANPDIHDLLPEMEAIGRMLGREAIKAMEAAGKDPVQMLYQTAKSLHKPAPPPPPTIDDLIKDPANRQKILADPNFQAEARKGYVQEIKDGAPPVVIGAQPGGTPIATPGEKPRSVREASSFFGRFLRSQ